jgi:tetratricopeptide (TPR) repeat protein
MELRYINEHANFVLSNQSLPPVTSMPSNSIVNSVINLPDSTVMKRTEELFEKGKQYLRDGLLNEAITAFSDTISNDSLFAPAYCQMGRALHRKKEFEQSIVYFKKAIKLKPNNSHFYYNWANCWFAQKHFSKAIANYRKAIKLGCRHAECYLNLGKSLENIGKLDEAEVSQKQALILNPNLEQAHLSLIRVRSKLRKKQQAEFFKNLDVVPASFENDYINHDVFDAYISLGDNCEAGLQFLRISYTESSFFRFTSSTFVSVFKILQNDFKDIFDREYIIPRPKCERMVKNTKYNIAFHSKLVSTINPVTGEQAFSLNYNFDEVFNNEKNKINYLIQKWNDLMNSNKKILFILKNDSQERVLKQKDLEKLVCLFLEKYSNRNFKIICLQLSKFKESKWNSEYLINHYFPCFAPRNSAKSADLKSWDNLFANYPLSQQLQIDQ